MVKFEFKTSALIGITFIATLIIVLIELLLKDNLDATLLLTLSFFVAPIQGTVAVVAAAEAAKGKWIEPLKKDLLAFYPLIAFCALLFTIFGFQLDIYSWTAIEHKWLNMPFFVIRNVVLLLISYLFAKRFAKASLQNSATKGRWALLYLLSFVTTQSLVAFDWVMSLEYPWISTLFGGIFFMEAFYTGLALLGIIAAYFVIGNSGIVDPVRKVMKDASTFMFGFALAWAGLFFAQYLVIWYGNIPHETTYFTKRMDHPFFSKLLWMHFCMLFMIPFLGLVASKVKLLPWWVVAMSTSILLGVLVERIYYILPVTSISIGWWIIEFLLMAFLLLIFFFSRDNFLKSA